MSQLRTRVPLRRPRRRRDALARDGAQPGHRRIRRASGRAHDRRRARADAGRAPLRHARTSRPTPRRSSRPSSGTSARASSPTRSRAATTTRTRTSCSSRSSGRPTATACSTSGTSSAIATGSTASWESNCIFVPRRLLEQDGGFDESFSMPGGGYANLEFYERMVSSPDVNVVDDPRRGLVPPGARRHDHQCQRARRSLRPDQVL